MTAGSILGLAAILAWSQVHTVGQLYGVRRHRPGGCGVAVRGGIPVVIAATEPSRRDQAL